MTTRSTRRPAPSPRSQLAQDHVRILLASLGGIGPAAPLCAGPIRFDWPASYDAHVDGWDNSSIVTVADFNGDGLPDVAAPAGYSTVIFTQQEGAFEPTLLLTNSLSVYHIYTGDVNGDRLPDLMWIDLRYPGPTALYYRLNTGAGGFGDEVAVPQGRFAGRAWTLDVNGDGFSDFAASTDGPEVMTYINDGAGGFSERVLYTSDRVEEDLYKLTQGDIDGDGDLDLVVLLLGIDGKASWTRISVLTNQGDGAYVETQRPSPDFDHSRGSMQKCDVALGDLDRDGDLDLAVSAGCDEPFDEAIPAQFTFLLNTDGVGSFEQPPSHALYTVCEPTYTASLSLSDLDMDGDLDALFTDGGGLFVLRNMEGAGFEKQVAFPTGTVLYNSAVGCADVDEDGVSDVILDGWGSFTVMRNITRSLGFRLRTGSPVQVGEQAVIEVAGLRNQERVSIYAALGPPASGVGVPALAWLVPELPPFPVALGTLVTNNSGRGRLEVPIPVDAAPGTYTVQAFVRRGSGGVDSVKSSYSPLVIKP